MFRFALSALGALALSLPAAAQVQPYPADFRIQEIQTNGTVLHARIGGQGPAVVLLHGYGETGDMWAPLAAELARDHTVVAPDLRGMGFSSRPESGYDKKTQGQDIAGALDVLGIGKADLVTHDIGNMVGYAFAAQYPARVTRFVIMDAPLPGVGPWDEIVRSRALWHFSFQGPDAERLVAGRERIYLDRFWNEFSADPSSFSEASREHYAKLYAQPGAMHAGFNQFAAFAQDAIDNKVCDAGPRRRRREILRPDDGGGNARRRNRRHRAGDPAFRSLVDGRATSRHDRCHTRLPGSLGDVCTTPRSPASGIVSLLRRRAVCAGGLQGSRRPGSPARRIPMPSPAGQGANPSRLCIAPHRRIRSPSRYRPRHDRLPCASGITPLLNKWLTMVNQSELRLARQFRHLILTLMAGVFLAGCGKIVLGPVDHECHVDPARSQGSGCEDYHD